MSLNECDVAFKELETLISKTKDLSEADTRAKIIDLLFLDILGWTEDDIRRESHVHKGYLDYIFSIDGTRKFILEAKRVGLSFLIPESFGGRYYVISGTISTDKKIRAAIEQVQLYCINSGVKYAVLTNGMQFILFEAFKYGADWRSGKCIVFRSLEDVKDNFNLFWNTLNKKSVSEGSLRKYISKEELPLKFYRPIDSLHSKDASITRNNLSPLLQPFIEFVFKDIIGEGQLEVLKNCYVKQKQFQIASRQINRQLDRSPDFAKKYNVKMILESGNSAGTFEELHSKSQKFLRTQAPRGNLMLLMGGIGAGKTTFIHHFFKFVIKDPSKTLWFYTNFLNAAPDPNLIQNHIFSSIIEDYDQKYKSKLEDELKAVGLEKISPNLESITILFSLLTLKGYTVSLVLDNVDQHSYVSPEYQERALLIAKHLTEKLKTITILALREESFFKSTMSGVLDAFPADVFHISSPSFEQLTRYRIKYVLELLKKTDTQLTNLMKVYVNFGASKEVVKRFFNIINDSLRSSRRKGEEILRFMMDISGGDMRLALHFFRTFLVSGNTDVDEMLMIDLRDREQGFIYGYQIPFHHVIKSIILEHSRLYSSTRSRIMNLFDLNPECSNSQFLNLHVLSYLNDRLVYNPPTGRGYVEIDSIIREAERVGISREAISYSLITMARFSLVQFENQSKQGYQTATFVRLTNTGSYYLNELVRKYIYLDLVWMDTPISDEAIVKELLDYVIELNRYKNPDDIERRFQRTEIFLDYLKTMEERDFKNNPEFKDSDLTRREFMPTIIQSYNEQKEFIKTARASK